ncbi:MAG: hypothetical protein WDZ51_09085, partial [Pirellulaceae bacterium]
PNMPTLEGVGMAPVRSFFVPFNVERGAADEDVGGPRGSAWFANLRVEWGWFFENLKRVALCKRSQKPRRKGSRVGSASPWPRGQGENTKMGVS